MPLISSRPKFDSPTEDFFSLYSRVLLSLEADGQRCLVSLSLRAHSEGPGLCATWAAAAVSKLVSLPLPWFSSLPVCSCWWFSLLSSLNGGGFLSAP